MSDPWVNETLPRAKDGPASSYADTGTNKNERVKGQHGAPRVLLWGPNNEALLTEENPGVVDVSDRADRELGEVSVPDGVHVTGSSAQKAPGQPLPSEAAVVAGKDTAGNVLTPVVGQAVDAEPVRDAWYTNARLQAFRPSTGNFERVRVDDQRNLLVGLRSSTGQEPTVATTGSDGVVTTTQRLFSATLMQAFNDNTVDRWRNNVRGTLLAIASRNTTTTSPSPLNYNHTGIRIHWRIVSVGSGNLTLRLWTRVDPDNNYGEAQLFALTRDTTGQYRIDVFRGAPATPPGTLTVAVNAQLPRDWYVDVVHNDGTTPWEYGVAYSLIL